MKSKSKSKAKRRRKAKAKADAKAAKAASKATLAKAKADGMAAAESVGVKFDGKGRVTNAAEVRNMAVGAAVSAAAAMGVNIMNADGTVNDAKAREAVSNVLGFSLDNKDALAQAKAEAEKAAVDMAKTLGVSIVDADGNIDKAKARQVAEVALQAENLTKVREGRREALDTLNISQDAFSKATNRSRQEAAAVVERLLSATVLKDGAINRESALKSLEAAVALAKTDEFIAKREEQSRREAADALSKRQSVKLKKSK